MKKRQYITHNKLWRVVLPDGRKAELMARRANGAAEMAAEIFRADPDWLKATAKIAEIV